MFTPILATKLYTPRPRSTLVPRPHLIKRLNEALHQNQGFERKLTLVSAPAGFGKTTLISEWIAKRAEFPEQSVAWLSLDVGDNDPNRFLAYLVAALQTIPILSKGAPIGQGVLTLLHAPQRPPIDPILTTLLNEIAAIRDEIILVLDDYHVLDSTEINGAIAFLLEYLPPQMHLVIITREDPPLPLARDRARGQMTELRAIDLRFTPAEVAQFLNEIMGLSLSSQNIAALENRTEGWIAGLQMAALALQGTLSTQGCAATADFIQTFSGGHRFILDYLLEEVLQRQPERVRSFLLQTAILERLSGPLCNAVTGQDDGREMLERLERGNLFVLPLDDQRQWYRYHHLFAEALRERLLAAQPDSVDDLHRRASQWYDQNDFQPDTIHHSLAANDFGRAADLIELAWYSLRASFFHQPIFLSWVTALPDNLVRTRPILCIGYAWELLGIGELHAAAQQLTYAEEQLALASAHDDENIALTEKEQLRSLQSSLANARAFHAQAVGNVSASVTHAQRALDLLPKTDHIGRGVATALYGFTFLYNGDLEKAYRYLAESMAFHMTGNIHLAISTTFLLADIRVTQGRLLDAIAVYEHSLKIALAQDNAIIQGTADLYLGLSDLSCERGDMVTANRYLTQSKVLAERAALPDWPSRCSLVQSRLAEIEGDLDEALELLDEAQRLYYPSPIPDIRPIAAQKIRLFLKQGRLNAALAWMREQNISVQDNLSYLREFEHITLARVLIAQYGQTGNRSTLQTVSSFLEQLQMSAETGERQGNVIKILLLRALVQEIQSNVPAALVTLQEALTLAEPEGYIRCFVDEGDLVSELLKEMKTALSGGGEKLNLTRVERERLNLYIVKLLAAFRAQQDALASLTKQSSLMEPLTPREREVLVLLVAGRSNPEIADQLVISITTVKTHVKNIFGKLQVTSRFQAIARAKELNLL